MQKKGWIMPYSNTTISEAKVQNLTLLPRIGSYPMKKVCVKNLVATRYKCEICNCDYKRAQSLRRHNQNLHHLGTRVCF